MPLSKVFEAVFAGAIVSLISVLRTFMGVTLAAGLAFGTAAAAEYAKERAAMIEMIQKYTADARKIGLDIAPIDEKVLAAMKAVPRHEFVPESLRDVAYTDRPLPIPEGQTISQPFIVALMTDLLEIGPDDTVLEVGTGSGYQAAVLARLARTVYSIEIVPELAESADTRLRRLGIDNVNVRAGDGYKGWPAAAPFDGIIVTAGAEEVPPPLLEQLAPGGRMVIPVGRGLLAEQLTLITKDAEGMFGEEKILPVRFVPLVRER